MVILFCISLCACGDNSSNTGTKSVESMAQEEVKYNIMAQIAIGYETEGLPQITYFVNKSGENEYEVTGKITVKDKYGDTYTGKYDALVEYDPVTDECSVKNCDIDSLYKD